MALRCVVMIEKWRAPSIIRKAMRRQLWSTTARLTLQPSSFALATPAASILRLAASVRRWVVTKSGTVRILTVCHSGSRAQRGSPESITTACEYGFRARHFVAPRNDRGLKKSSHQLAGAGREQLLCRHRLGDD